MRARKGKGNNDEAKATEKDGVPAYHHGARKAELDGRGQVPELPPQQQGLRHEMM